MSRFLNLVRRCVPPSGVGTLSRICFHARFMVWTVQCLRGRPTRFLRDRFGMPLGPMKVACLVGASGGSLRMCISSFCCDRLISAKILGMLVGGPLPLPRPLPFPLALGGQRILAARSRTRLLVLLRSMKVVCILNIFVDL